MKKIDEAIALSVQIVSSIGRSGGIILLALVTTFLAIAIMDTVGVGYQTIHLVLFFLISIGIFK